MQSSQHYFVSSDLSIIPLILYPVLSVSCPSALSCDLVTLQVEIYSIKAFGKRREPLAVCSSSSSSLFLYSRKWLTMKWSLFVWQSIRTQYIILNVFTSFCLFSSICSSNSSVSYLGKIEIILLSLPHSAVVVSRKIHQRENIFNSLLTRDFMSYYQVILFHSINVCFC